MAITAISLLVGGIGRIVSSVVGMLVILTYGQKAAHRTLTKKVVR